MMILLDEAETKKWLHMIECEKTPEETSRLPDDMGCKRPLVRLSAEQKDGILQMTAEGRKVPDIAKSLGINGRQVSGVVQGHKHPIQANIAAQADREFYARQAAHKDATAFIEEASQKLVDRGSMKPIVIPMGKAESPAKEPITRQDRIDAIIQMGSSIGLKHVTIAAQINNDMGGQWLPDDVSKRLAELRGET